MKIFMEICSVFVVGQHIPLRCFFVQQLCLGSDPNWIETRKVSLMGIKLFCNSPKISLTNTCATSMVESEQKFIFYIRWFTQLLNPGIARERPGYIKLCRGRVTDRLFQVLDRAPKLDKSKEMQESLMHAIKGRKKSRTSKFSLNAHTIDRACHSTPGLVVKLFDPTTCKLGKWKFSTNYVVF